MSKKLYELFSVLREDIKVSKDFKDKLLNRIKDEMSINNTNLKDKSSNKS